MKTYAVNRKHYGDRTYVPGDVREANEADVAHLVRNGVLTLKAEKPVDNKAASKLRNKAD